MQDPKRLDNFYEELKNLHKTSVPDWRFGQMLMNVFAMKDMFYLEEDEILKEVKEYFEKRNFHKG